MGSAATIAGIVDGGRTSSMEDGGPTIPGQIADPPRRRTHAEPDSSPRRPAGCFEVRGVPAVLHPSSTQRAVGRNLALDLVAAVGVGVSEALVGAAPDDRAARRPRPDGARGPRRGALHREPPRRVRRPGRAALPRTARAHPRCRGGVPARALRRPDRADRRPRRDRLLDQPVVRQPVPPPAVGAMYPGRLRGRIVGVLGTGRAAAGALAAIAGGIVADLLGGPTAVASPAWSA